MYPISLVAFQVTEREIWSARFNGSTTNQRSYAVVREIIGIADSVSVSNNLDRYKIEHYLVRLCS